MTWTKYNSAGEPVVGTAGVLGVPNGGTGVSTVASGNLLLGAGASPLTALAGSSSGQVPTWNGSAWAAAAPAIVPAFILINNQVAQNTAQETYTANSYNNITPTEVIDTGGHCSIAGSVITLAAGTYMFFSGIILVANGGTWGGYLELYNNSDAVRIQRGLGGSVAASARFMQPIMGLFTIATSKDILWRVYMDGQNSANTGALNVTSEVEVYAQLSLIKFA